MTVQIEQEQRCATCRYWSDKLADMRHGVLLAVCLSRESPNCRLYVSGANSCEEWHQGEPIDEGVESA